MLKRWTCRANRSRGYRGVLAACAASFWLAACAQTGSVDGDTAEKQDPATGQEAPAGQAGTGASDIADNPRLELEAPESGGEVDLRPPEGAAARQTVGLLLPLSGPRAALGQSMLRAAELAMFDVADDSFELVVRDTKGTPGGAESAARSAIDAGANLLLGPVFSSSVQAVKPVADAGSLPMVAFSNNRNVAEPGAYVMGLLPSEQVQRVVGYAARQGLRRFAVLAPRNAYGQVVVQALQEAAARGGASFAGAEFYAPGSKNVAEEAKRLARQYWDGRLPKDAQNAAPPANAFDAVMLPAGGQDLRAVAPTLPFFDVDPERVKFLGTVLWNDPSLGTEPTLVGGWFAAPPPESWQNFERRYRETFGDRPRRLASLAYDATALAGILARQSDSTGPEVYSRSRLTQRNGFAGVDGVFRLNDDGTAERLYAVMEMQRKELKVVDPAPGSFEALAY